MDRAKIESIGDFIASEFADRSCFSVSDVPGRDPAIMRRAAIGRQERDLVNAEFGFIEAQIAHLLYGTPAPPQPRECMSPLEAAIREYIAERADDALRHAERLAEIFRRAGVDVHA